MANLARRETPHRTATSRITELAILPALKSNGPVT